MKLIAPGPEDTREVGRRLGRSAYPGAVVALVGDLGMGKTVLAKGMGEGLDVPTLVTSPTFVIVAAHEGGRLPYWHADLYRLGDDSELEQLGLDELAESDGVTVIEWAERFPEVLPRDHLVIRLTELDGGRQLDFEATGPKSRQWLGSLG